MAVVGLSAREHMEHKYGEVMLIVLNMDIPAQERYRLGRPMSIM